MSRLENTFFVFPKKDIKAQMWIREINGLGYEARVLNYYRLNFLKWLATGFIKESPMS